MEPETHAHPATVTPLTDAQDALLVKYTNLGGGTLSNGDYKADFTPLTNSQKLKLLCVYLATLE